MASIVIRSILGPTAIPWARLAPRATRISKGTTSFSTSSSRFQELPSTPSSSSSSTSTFTPPSQGNPSDPPATLSTPTNPGSFIPSISNRSTTLHSQKSTTSPGSFIPNTTSTTRSSLPNESPPGYRWEPEHSLSSGSARWFLDNSPTHTLTVTSTRNNTLLTFSDRVGPLFKTITGGSDTTFKKSNRASYEAAHQATLKTIEKVLAYAADRGPRDMFLRVAFRGLVAQGREAVANAISGPEGEEIRKMIRRIEDRTPVKVGGTRARKARRL